MCCIDCMHWWLLTQAPGWGGNGVSQNGALMLDAFKGSLWDTPEGVLEMRDTHSEAAKCFRSVGFPTAAFGIYSTPKKHLFEGSGAHPELVRCRPHSRFKPKETCFLDWGVKSWIALRT